ncbi:MAG TPA: helix-turn-helix domain-containing protein [Solirubrobacteraceae bacterium]|jgi:AcrR family transcriptional regulator|nr:helix-turn-helix domain-containing protein [Solirubrobacteraceae bacterium]
MQLDEQTPVLELPVIGSELPERADAARNRQRILCTAQRLFAERGPECVSMDEIADAAGVGKGTLFRRFGSRAQLAQAVLSERETALQESFIRGEPPLGPGAPPVERLIAFGCARLDLIADHAAVLIAAEAGPERFASPPYQVSRLHLILLLREADPLCDADYLAEVLLACLAVDFYVFLGGPREMTLERLKSGWEQLVRRIVPACDGSAAAAIAAASN